MTSPGITAIIVNHNAETEIVKAIRKLDAQDGLVDAILVIDNASTDNSVAAARAASPRVEVIELGENLGPAISRNRGMQAAKTPLVLLVDDDVYVASGCIAQLLTHLDDPQVAAVVPRLILYPDNALIQLDGAETHLVGSMVLNNARLDAATTPAAVSQIGAFSTSCVLARRDVMLAAGGMDENYFIYLEDQEFGLRLRSLGHKLVCDAKALAYHDRGAGTPNLSFRDAGEYPRRRAYLTMRNRWQTILIHYQPRTLILLAPVLLLYEIASLAMAARKGWLRQWWQAWAWQWQNRQSLRERRRFVAENRRLSEASSLVGGPLPLAPGLIGKGLEARAVGALTAIISGYGRLVRPLLPR